MSLELLMLGNVPIAQMVERAKLAEANGYDTLWVADERFYREVYATLAILAQHTTRVHLGTCVTDPFSLASCAATRELGSTSASATDAALARCRRPPRVIRTWRRWRRESP